MPITEGTGYVTPSTGGAIGGLSKDINLTGTLKAINNPAGASQGGNTYQSSSVQSGGMEGGLAANIFDSSKEFTTLPIRFGTLFKSSIQILADSIWTPVLGYTDVSEFGIHPDAPSGVLSFLDLPPTAWVQVYGWLQFAASATNLRFGRICDNGSGLQLMAGAECQPGNNVGTMFSWCSLPYCVLALGSGVRLEAWQNSGAPLNLAGAALWAKRIY